MRRFGAALIAVALLAGACSSSPSGKRELVVFAAASLTESFTEIGAGFERAHSAVRVRINFGPSDGLATGIQGGAPADVFASASPRWMEVVAGDPGVSDRTIFARNRLILITPAANRAGVAGLRDLAKPGLKLVLAASGVPAGQYAREVLAKAGLSAAERNVVSNEEDVKGVVQKVILDEADAGIVYATDVTARVAQQVRAIPIEDAFNVEADYPIAIIRGSRRAADAQRFIGYVTGVGRTVLRAHGFLPPP